MTPIILIDATTVTEKVDGLSQYIINLLSHLPPESFEIFQFKILVNKNNNRPELEALFKQKKFEKVETKIAPIGPKRDWDFFWFLLKHGKSFNLFHSTSNQYPIVLKHGVVTIHDITFRKYFDEPWWSPGLAKAYMNFVLRITLKKARKVIAVSDATKADLIKSYKLKEKNAEKIVAIHEGWEHIKENAETENEKFNVPYRNFLFYLGTSRKHKNIENLLVAFNSVIDRIPDKINLVISGSNNYLNDKQKKIIEKINSNGERITFTGYVSSNLLSAIFKQADAFIFPSLSEGFGIPILESFYFKKPVLCSNLTSLPEIAGNAALYFNPYSPDDIAKTIQTFYESKVLQNELIEKGQVQLSKFSWWKTSLETVEVYKKILLNN